MNDTLLRKNSLVQTATHVIHEDRSVYGDDARLFNAYRFLPTVDNRLDKEDAARVIDPASQFRDSSGKVHAGAFRPFGSGNISVLGGE